MTNIYADTLMYYQSLRVEIADLLYAKGVISQKQREGFNFVTNFQYDKPHFLNNIKMFCALRDIPEETWKEIDSLIRNDERFDVLFPESMEEPLEAEDDNMDADEN